MHIFKKLSKLFVLLPLIVGGVFFFSSAIAFDSFYERQGYYYDDKDFDEAVSNISTIEIGNIITAGSVTPDDSILSRLLDIFGFTSEKGYDGVQKALVYAKAIINMLLGLVSLVALIVLIYAFYMMFVGDGEKQWGTIKKIIVGVAIALVVLGFSWLIVSFIFSFYTENLLNAV